MDPNFSSAHPIHTATAVPLREFKENQSVRKKVTAENPIFKFLASSKMVYTALTAARFLVLVLVGPSPLPMLAGSRGPTLQSMGPARPELVL
jgi:hypothetical protein